MTLPQLDLGTLPEIIAALVTELSEHAKQGASPTEWMDQQAMCVVEEAGEFVGAYRRWRGFARRPGNAQDVEDELADVIVSTCCMIELWSRVWSGADGSGDPIGAIVAKKLSTIFSRGWVNKDEVAVRPNDPGHGTSGLGSYTKDEVPPPTYGVENSDNGFGLLDSTIKRVVRYSGGERMFPIPSDANTVPQDCTADDFESGFCGRRSPHPQHLWRISPAIRGGLGLYPPQLCQGWDERLAP